MVPYVEQMAPIFTTEVLRAIYLTFGASRSHWGMDVFIWPLLLHNSNMDRIAVIDAVEVYHDPTSFQKNYTRNFTLESSIRDSRVAYEFAANSEFDVSYFDQ